MRVGELSQQGLKVGHPHLNVGREKSIKPTVKREGENSVLPHCRHIYSLSMPTSDQCALGPDGKLLDASEIVWVNDPSDPMPIAPIQQARVDTTALPPKSSVTHLFFHSDPPPAVMITGLQCSAHIP